jgi:hypothetical protein
VIAATCTLSGACLAAWPVDDAMSQLAAVYLVWSYDGHAGDFKVLRAT